MIQSCAAYAEALSAKVDGELPVAEQVFLDAHIDHCDHCRTRFGHLVDLRRRALVSTAPSLDDLIARINVGDIGPEGRRRRSTPRRVGRLVGAVAVVLAVVGASVAAFPHRPTASAKASPAGSVGSVVTVRVVDQQVTNRHVTIRRGDQVRWLNTDLNQHHLVIDGGGAQIDGYLARRGSETVTYLEPGTYHFECKLHRGLSGTVTVL